MRCQKQCERRSGRATRDGFTRPGRLAGLVFSAAAAVASTMAPQHARAVVYRDDRDPSRYLALAQDPRYAAVGKYTATLFGNGPGTAAGVLIAPDWVLTSGNLVMAGTDDVTFTIGGRTYAADQWFPHEAFGHPQTRRQGNIGLAHLTEPVTGVTPAQRLPATIDPLGLTTTMVGYGVTIKANDPAPAPDGRPKSAGTNVLDAYSVFTDDGRPTEFQMDFDSPSGDIPRNTGSLVPTDLEAGFAGDTGGGMFVEVGGITYLAGIMTSGLLENGLPENAYGTFVVGTPVGTFNDWIDSHIAVTPEPSAAAVLLIAATGWTVGRRRRRGRTP